MPTLAQVSFANNICWFVLLAFIVSQRRQADWLLGLLLVLGAMLTTQIMQLTAIGDKTALDRLDPLLSVLSTWVLVKTSLELLHKKALVLKAGVIVTLFVQSYAALAANSPETLALYRAADLGGCLIGGGLFAVALARRFSANKYLSLIGFAGPVLWGVSCCAYYLNAEVYPTIYVVGKCGMIAGAGISCLMSALLALREPPSETPPRAIALA